jgi:serine/threonine protein phosphatase PrpC
MALSVADLRKVEQPDGQDAPRDSTEVAHVVAFKTDIGKRHHVNQDSGSVWTWVRADGTPVSLLAVADGVSAGRHSEDASRLAIDVVYGRLAPLLQDDSQDIETMLAVLIQAVKDVNHELAARPHVAVASADATTLVTAFSVGDQVAGAWVGDSRVYQVSAGEISRLTTDHSWAEGVVSRGLMSVEQASRDPRAHMIMRWLGPPDQEDPGVDAFRASMGSGDIIFCCTDGLYGYFSPPNWSEEEMARVFLTRGVDLAGALDELVDTALARGGHDNITVAALRLESGASEETGYETQKIPALSRDEASQTVQMSLSPKAPAEG